MTFSQTSKLNYLQAAEQRQQQAFSQGATFCQTVQDVNNNWQAAKPLMSADELQQATLEFCAYNKQKMDEAIPAFAGAFAILGGGILAEDGNLASGVLSVRDVVELVVASAVSQGLMAPEA